jgi:hypothetical protein
LEDGRFPTVTTSPNLHEPERNLRFIAARAAEQDGTLNKEDTTVRTDIS